MPTETVKVEEQAEFIRSEKAPESSSGDFFVRSRALSSVFIFLVLFTVLSCILPQRERIDFLIRKLSADCWCPRFERFLCSSSKPDILMLSSSVGFVPSLMSDIKNSAVPVPTSVIELQKLSVNYACPAFFLAALSSHGVKNASAAYMGIPTANITDDLLLLEKALAFGKKPEVVILSVNVRDFAVPANWPAIDKLDEPIKTELGDLAPMPAMLSGNRVFRVLFAYARPSQLTRCMENYRFYFAYETYCLTRAVPVLKGVFGQSDILRNRMATESESENRYNPQDAAGVNSERFNPQTQNDILALTNKGFENRQFAALHQIIAATQSHGIKLVIAQVPVYPGICAPSILAKRYADAIAGAAHENGVFILGLKQPDQYSYGHFGDLLHLNGVGGERFFWRLAEYVAAHKTELLNR
jgi:hypothetical protein